MSILINLTKYKYIYIHLLNFFFLDKQDKSLHHFLNIRLDVDLNKYTIIINQHNYV